MLQRIAHDPVQIRRCDTLPGQLEQHLGMVQQQFNVFSRLARDECNRNMPHRRKRVTQISHPFAGRYRTP